jgi:predicted aspartyl protease
MSTAPQAFTVEYNEITSSLATNCGICEAYNPVLQHGQTHPPISEFKALWDTGAMGSVVSASVVQALGLKSTGKARVFHANGESIVNTYSINILLPNKVTFSTLRVTEGILNDTDVLIGMDIISRGDFSVTTSQGKTKFSFQVPSTHDTDYVKEFNQKMHTPITKEKEPGRNDPCPCGSGKKYKQCHGKNE